MTVTWEGFIDRFDKAFPIGSPRRKLLQLVAIILLFEGITVLLLFSYFGIPVGLLSLALGIFLLILLHPGTREIPAVPEKIEPRERGEDPPGLKLVDAIVLWIGNDYIISALGASVIVLVLLYNFFISGTPDIGDLDTLTMVFGGLVMVYPLLAKKFRVEAAFSLLFLGLVVLFLVVPQAVTSYRQDAGSSIGGWYVDYMLARPFSGMLNLIGIPSSSQGSMVTLTFHDGTVQHLGISAYCAGLYSFSIFMAAFFSFVLVFERLRTRVLVIVLALGLLVAYLGNLFRMVIIGIVGYYRGIDALLWAHQNVGWIIFLSWSAVFWYLLLRYTSKPESRVPSGTEAN